MFASFAFGLAKTIKNHQIPIPKLISDKNGIWLPKLKRVLPHTYRLFAESSDKAAKNDNAPLHFGLWNQRILSLFPDATETHLDVIRHFFLGVQKRQLYLQCLNYLWS